jgi:hypothetical protein
MCVRLRRLSLAVLSEHHRYFIGAAASLVAGRYGLFHVQNCPAWSAGSVEPKAGIFEGAVRRRRPTIGDAVHVLHAFQKKTQATAKRDIDLARARLRQIR